MMGRMGQRMSETEALMWAVEADPNLGSTMGAVLILDGRPDPRHLRAVVTAAVAAMPRLRQRVAQPLIPVGGAEWVPDRAFDLDHHLRHVRLPAPGTADLLRQLACQFVADPFDRTRPLWQVLAVDGLRGGRSAVVTKLHHSVADGTGALLAAQQLFQLSADEPPPDPVDLSEVFDADLLAAGDGGRPPLADQVLRGAERALRFVSDAASALTDPATVPALGAQALDAARALAAQLPGTARHTSALWATRSRNRRLEWLAVPFDRAKARAHELGGSLNDLFVTAVTEGAVAYHRHHGVEVDELTATIVVSTRDGAGADLANAFVPAAVVLPATAMGAEERFAAVSAVLAQHKAAAKRAREAIGPLAGLALLVPPPLAAVLALDQASRIDFATSNLRGLPVPVWLAGRRVRALYPVGPVVGTAFNVTLMSNLDELHLGLHVDPVAVSDPAGLARNVGAGFAQLGVRPHRRAP
jgi:WS/DGAT/MGAT family acyltransferase